MLILKFDYCRISFASNFILLISNEKFMKKILTLLAALCFIAFNNLDLFSADTTIVQTFTFEDIYKRRGLFVMPPKTESFSKILILYTLKCDPKTPHDKYNCGEWDYLTSNVVYSKTGRYDSTKIIKKMYSFGFATPDTLFYSKKPVTYTREKARFNTSINSVENPQTFTLPSTDEYKGFSGKSIRLQYYLKSKELRDLGMKTGKYSKLQFTSNSVGKILKNLTISLKSISFTPTTNFDNNQLTTVYKNDYLIAKEGLQDIYFMVPFNWTQLQSLLVDIYYEQDDDTQVAFKTDTTHTGLISNTQQSYLTFENPNDFVYFDDIPELNNAEKFTLEGWVNIKKWSNWSYIFNKNDQIILCTGTEVGKIYCMVRNPDNTYGYATNAVKLNEWAHLAMVFDASQPNNSDKLKLYVNGERLNLFHSGEYPARTSTNSKPFTISGNSHQYAAINASIDDVRIWEDALSQEVISNFRYKTLENHPNINALVADLTFSEQKGFTTSSQPPSNVKGILVGMPSWEIVATGNTFNQVQTINSVPALSFSNGDFSIKVDTLINIDTLQKDQLSIVEYKIENNDIKIKDIYYHHPTGWIYNFKFDGTIADSFYVAPDDYFVNKNLEYYSVPAEVIDKTEIGRFITPYGINLDLGPQGFTWVYDVTDYEPLLHDTIDFASGNLQELIDVKFLFIKGTPPRKVNKIHKVWGSFASYLYKDLAADNKLSKVNFDLLPESKSFKMKTRLTGHGHNSNDGSYPHCCEWKDNTHYLYSSQEIIASWHIWQTNDCGDNPVFPQGGTWPRPREGWCPGDVVKDNDFEVTKYVNNNQINLDYDITKVPTDNLGMGNGNYYTAMQLFEYGENAFDLDAEVYEVIMPSNFDYYSRTNPICSSPTIIIRNNSIDNLTSLDFEYYVEGGEKSTFQWTGNIASMTSQKIQLSVPSSNFWIGDGSNKFTVKISNPNGKEDLNTVNDSFTSDFNMPDLLEYSTKIILKTNARGSNFSYKLTDVFGNIIDEKSSLSNNQIYEIPLDLPQGCYTFEVIDNRSYGLSYWAYPEQGSGYLKIVNGNGNDLKIFDPDFGRGIKYSMFIGSYSLVQDANLDDMIYLFPVPTENLLNVSLNDITGNIKVRIFDVLGLEVFNSNYQVEANQLLSIPTDSMKLGSYIIQIENGNRKITKKFVKK